VNLVAVAAEDETHFLCECGRCWHVEFARVSRGRSARLSWLPEPFTSIGQARDDANDALPAYPLPHPPSDLGDPANEA